MELDGNDLRDLALSLRLVEVERLNEAELRAVLAWVSGRGGAEGGLTPLLGPPGAEPFLLEQVYWQLDRFLFAEDELREAAAALGGDVVQRRIQYRRLLAAFHPDRSEALAGWLTPRFQAVQRSYRRFREAPEKRFAPQPRLGHSGGQPRWWGRRIGLGAGLRMLVQNQLQGVRHLEAKLVGLAAILALAVVAQVYIAQAPNRWAQAEQREAQGQGAALDAVSEAATNRPERPAAPGSDAADGRAPERGSADAIDPASGHDAPEQVTDVIRQYQLAFAEGDIQTLMRLLSDQPRENADQGRDWFRRTYTRIFGRSDLRSLQVDMEMAEPDGDAWIVSGRFDLEIHYPGGRQVAMSGPIRYRLIPQNQEWHIAGIDY